MLFLSRMLQAGDYVDPMALTREVYLPVFYPGTTDAASAAPVDVAPGSDRRRYGPYCRARPDGVTVIRGRLTISPP